MFIATQWNTGRATGEAFAVMQSEDAAVALVSVANMAKLKDRSLEARVVHKSELYNAISRPLQLGGKRRHPKAMPCCAAAPTCTLLATSPIPARGKPPKLSDPDSHETFVLARGVGSAATEAEIAEFFAAVQVCSWAACRRRQDVAEDCDVDAPPCCRRRRAVCSSCSTPPAGPEATPFLTWAPLRPPARPCAETRPSLRPGACSS